MRYKGFTVVEMVVVITIIGVLASLATVQLLRSETVSRDKQRADDVTSISLTLQDIYDTGQVDDSIIASGDVSVTNSVPMGYPSTQLVNSSYMSMAQASGILQSIRLDARKSPNLHSGAVSPSFSIVAATSTADLDNGAKTAGGIALSTTNDVYVYQPFDSNGALCLYATGLVSTGAGTSATTGKVGINSSHVIAPRLADNCVRYNIYYLSESQDMIIKVRSKRISSDGLY